MEFSSAWGFDRNGQPLLGKVKIELSQCMAAQHIKATIKQRRQIDVRCVSNSVEIVYHKGRVFRTTPSFNVRVLKTPL